MIVTQPKVTGGASAHLSESTTFLKEKNEFLSDFLKIQYKKQMSSRQICHSLINQVAQRALSNHKEEIESFEKLDIVENQAQRIEETEEQDQLFQIRLNGYSCVEWKLFLDFSLALELTNQFDALEDHVRTMKMHFPETFLTLFANFEQMEMKLKNDIETKIDVYLIDNQFDRCLRLLARSEDAFFQMYLMEAKQRASFWSFFHFRKAILLQKMNSWSDILVALNSALYLDPKNLFAVERKAMVLMHLKESQGFGDIIYQVPQFRLMNDNDIMKELKSCLDLGLKRCKNSEPDLRLSFVLNSAKFLFQNCENEACFNMMKTHMSLGMKNLQFCLVYASLLIDREQFKESFRILENAKKSLKSGKIKETNQASVNTLETMLSDLKTKNNLHFDKQNDVIGTENALFAQTIYRSLEK